MASFVEIGSKKLTTAEGLQEKIERINTERGNGFLVCKKIICSTISLFSISIPHVTKYLRLLQDLKEKIAKFKTQYNSLLEMQAKSMVLENEPGLFQPQD